MNLQDIKINTDMPEYNPEFMEAWLVAMETGMIGDMEYHKGRCALVDGEGGYCCQGTACQLAITLKVTFQGRDVIRKDEMEGGIPLIRYAIRGEHFQGGHWPAPVAHALGMTHGGDGLGFVYSDTRILGYCNDGPGYDAEDGVLVTGYTHAEIAAHIRSILAAKQVQS